MFAITRTRVVRAAAASGIAAAALLGTVGPASAAPAADSAVASSARYTETTLNIGKSLSASSAGTVILTQPNAADGRQLWQADSRTLVVNGVNKFGYELRNDTFGTCVTDVGADARVQFKSCDTHAGTNTNNSRQVWLFKFGRTVNAKNYYFWENANTGRKLMLDTFTSEGPFPSFTVIASTLKANPGTSAEASQLFHEVRVA